MTNEKIGLWLIGAWGGVSTTAVVGLSALQQKLTPEIALVSALPQFAALDLVDWNQLVVGGHEIRKLSYRQTAAALHESSGVFSLALLQSIEEALDAADARIRPGTLLNVGPTIERLADEPALQFRGETPSEAVARLKNDIEEFRQREELARVIVLNLSSTEPPCETSGFPSSWPAFEDRLHSDPAFPVPASTLYAIAALQSGCPYINFTPSTGSNLPALWELAEQQGVVHVGQDGKTGETLMKSVLAPMFLARNLKVLSWVGHNIFGNMDAVVLDDPVNKASKAHSKDHLLTDILGYKPQTLVSIEYIESMGDWKTAWDHIHFAGFLGTKMKLQFIWEGCDSLLAAPLALDLVRFTEREQRRGGKGILRPLCSFFKSPMGENIPAEFHQQYALLEEWARKITDTA